MKLDVKIGAGMTASILTNYTFRVIDWMNGAKEWLLEVIDSYIESINT